MFARTDSMVSTRVAASFSITGITTSIGTSLVGISGLQNGSVLAFKYV